MKPVIDLVYEINRRRTFPLCQRSDPQCLGICRRRCQLLCAQMKGVNDRAEDEGKTKCPLQNDGPKMRPCNSEELSEPRGQHEGKTCDVKATQGEMNAEDIETWRNYYRSPANMEAYLYDTYEEDRNKSLLRNQESFIATKAELAVLAHKPEQFIAKHGELYRWRLQYDKVFKGDKEACFAVTHAAMLVKEMEADSNCPLPDGWRWLLQLRTARTNSWKDWLYIKKSEKCGVRLGVFAARDFCNRTRIGYYTGPIVWKASEAGTAKPSKEDLTLQGIDATQHARLMRNDEGQYVVTNPLPVVKEPGRPLYLGMQYIKDVGRLAAKDRGEVLKGKDKHNCVLVDDGSVIASKKINPNAELWLLNNLDEEQDETKEKVDRERELRKLDSAKRKALLKTDAIGKRMKLK